VGLRTDEDFMADRVQYDAPTAGTRRWQGCGRLRGHGCASAQAWSGGNARPV